MRWEIWVLFAPMSKPEVKTRLQRSDSLETFHYKKTAETDDRVDGRRVPLVGQITSISSDTRISPPKVLECFDIVRRELSHIMDETRLTGFIKCVPPVQAQLVCAYIVEAFEDLGCSLSGLKEGDSVSVPSTPQRAALMKQLHMILESSSLIQCQESSSIHSVAPISRRPAQELLQGLLDKFPQHTQEHRLLGTTGPYLAGCLCGKEEPLQHLFGNETNKDLLTDVYTNAPVFATGTRLLAKFFSELIATKSLSAKIRILEIGGGLGSTTASIIELLEASGHPFTYTFTDISSSLVGAAKKRFTGHPQMKSKVLDIEAMPTSSLFSNQDVIIAANVIHATKNIKDSCTNILKMLEKQGILCLIEVTRNFSWFDIVFGQLDGWWRFEDGRKHAIVNMECWERSLLDAGFENVVHTGDGETDSDLVGLVVASEPEPCAEENVKMTMETIMFKEIDQIPLYADIYYPRSVQKTKSKRPIGMPQIKIVLCSGHCRSKSDPGLCTVRPRLTFTQQSFWSTAVATKCSHVKTSALSSCNIFSPRASSPSLSTTASAPR